MAIHYLGSFVAFKSFFVLSFFVCALLQWGLQDFEFVCYLLLPVQWTVFLIFMYKINRCVTFLKGVDLLQLLPHPKVIVPGILSKQHSTSAVSSEKEMICN